MQLLVHPLMKATLKKIKIYKIRLHLNIYWLVKFLLIRYSNQDYRLNRFFFPERNKTMSALSLGTIIVEAGETSGSLIQASAALEQNRKLFILDSCFQNSELTWPAKYLGKGAFRINKYQDISSELKLSYEHSADYTSLTTSQKSNIL